GTSYARRRRWAVRTMSAGVRSRWTSTTLPSAASSTTARPPVTPGSMPTTRITASTADRRAGPAVGSDVADSGAWPRDRRGRCRRRPRRRRRRTPAASGAWSLLDPRDPRDGHAPGPVRRALLAQPRPPLAPPRPAAGTAGHTDGRPPLTLAEAAGVAGTLVATAPERWPVRRGIKARVPAPPRRAEFRPPLRAGPLDRHRLRQPRRCHPSSPFASSTPLTH